MASRDSQEVIMAPPIDPDMLRAIDQVAENVLAVAGVAGSFSRAVATAKAVGALQQALDVPGVMDCVMALQGSPLGFRTDKDTANPRGYPQHVVRDAFVEATFRGLLSVGNQWNIIGARQYTTREGFEYLFRARGKDHGVTDLLVVSELPTAGRDGNANVVVNLNWKQGGEPRTQVLNLPIRVNAGMGADAVLGKASRKALAWLWRTVTGSDVAEGDADSAQEPVSARASTIENGALIGGTPMPAPTGALATEPDANDPWRGATPQAVHAEVARLVKFYQFPMHALDRWAASRAPFKGWADVSIPTLKRICIFPDTWVSAVTLIAAPPAEPVA